jgi:hypothetical protein
MQDSEKSEELEEITVTVRCDSGGEAASGALKRRSG